MLAERQKLDSWMGHRMDSFCGESTSTPGLKVFVCKFGFSVWQMQWISFLHCRFRLTVSWWNPYLQTRIWPYLKYSDALLFLRSCWVVHPTGPKSRTPSSGRFEKILLGISKLGKWLFLAFLQVILLWASRFLPRYFSDLQRSIFKFGNR